MVKIDPITLEVLKNALIAIAEEMKVIIMRTCYSYKLKTCGDLSCALFDNKGQMAVMGNDLPVHLGSMPFVVKAVMEEFETEEFEEGDEVIMNDPYSGGIHLNDVTLVKPIFFESELFAFAVSRAHWLDVGGFTPGGAYDNTEIYQEGLRIPPIKLYERYKQNNAIISMIQANTRDPRDRLGDLRAQHAGNLRADLRLRQLIDKYGEDSILTSMQEVMNYSERIVRADIRNIPKGQFEFTDYMDGDGFPDNGEDSPIKLHVTLTIGEDSMEFDFTGTDKQSKNSVNSPYAQTMAMVYYVVKAVISSEALPNAGCWRPINVVVPEGTILNCKFPAPVFFCTTDVANMVADLLMGVFAKVVPDRVIAASGAGGMALYISGSDPRYGNREYIYSGVEGVGWGARFNKDGINSTRVHGGNTMNTPIEQIETLFPLRVSAYELVTDSGGPGKYRGGLSSRRIIRLIDHEGRIMSMGDRKRMAPWGLFGGKEGRVGKLIVYPPRSTKGRILPHKPRVFYGEPDSAVVFQTPGSGGVGNPLKRNPELVLRDVILGYVSMRSAEEDYGVIIDPQTLIVNLEATQKLRDTKLSK